MQGRLAHRPLTRRAWIVASATAGATTMLSCPFGNGARAMGAPAEAPRGGGTAKSTILFFLCGGASHLDTWDLKPDAPAEYRGPFEPIETTASGVRLSEHLPRLSRHGHRLALINSLGATVNTNDHHAGYYYHLTGHVPDATFLSLGNNRTPYPDDWPFVGTVIGSRRSGKSELPGVITLPHKPSEAPYTRPGQFAAKLGVEHDPLYVLGNPEKPLEFKAPALVLDTNTSPDRLGHRRALLGELDVARRDLEQFASTGLWTKQQSRAFQLLLSSQTTAAFDIASEPESLRARYGSTVNATSLIAARRLVEAGVPFITVFWRENKAIAKKCASEGGWDTHGNNFNCLKENLLPEFDQAFSALLDDLSERGLLDSTLVWVTSEMGRRPKIGDPRSGGNYGAGRDHWTHCQTDLLIGGGVRGGQVYGSSDRFGEYPADKPVTPADVAHTVYHAMGVTDLETRDRENRPIHLLDTGRPLVELF